ncbi:MAG: pyruvate formate lyase-activating protein [Candidatus Azobacteroides sp.]|nr:pyruvate formate lyase-activating protein [Candidatus Azobacteroides sp.]
MDGYIHSFESFGTKDGPGIRFVFFMQGCPLKCLYCHNVDTWGIKNKKYVLSPEEAFAEVQKVKPFIRTGGVTVSGGEPLLQPDFLLDFFRLCKKEHIHTAIDTSGYLLNERIKEVLELTDLVLLDVKHINPEKYKKLTSVALEPTLNFLDYLAGINKPTWIRYVLVPGYTDAYEDLHAWAKYISGFSMVERVEILPFHQMGMHKWDEVWKNYQLKNVPTANSKDVKRAESIFRQYKLHLAN